MQPRITRDFKCMAERYAVFSRRFCCAGEVVGWVDWEDVAIGPLMFDVGCAIIGCCYRSQEGEDNLLDTDRLSAFMGKKTLIPSDTPITLEWFWRAYGRPRCHPARRAV